MLTFCCNCFMLFLFIGISISGMIEIPLLSIPVLPPRSNYFTEVGV